MRPICSLILLLVLAPRLSAAPHDEMTRVFQTLYAVYDTAGILESLKVDGRLPRVKGTRELSQAKFGSDSLVPMLVDGWGTPLHVESVPGKGYIVVAAGSDRKFNRSTWRTAAKTSASSDDVVLADGKLIRSPEEWALAVAAPTLQQLSEAAAHSKKARTVAALRSIATAMSAYAAENGTFPPVGNVDALRTHLEPTYVKTLPRVDGWGHKFDLAMESTLASYSIISAGADGKFDTDDDIVLQHDGTVKNGEAAAAHPLVDAWAGYQAARKRLQSLR